MRERRFLTKDFVNSVRPPSSGERWISDTAVRGFGLRIWRSKNGEGKAFAIRISDADGIVVRQTYDGEARNEYWPPHHRRRTLGEVVENARVWARERIEEIKGFHTLRDEEAIQRYRIKTAFGRVRLKALAEAKFRGMTLNGASDHYVFALKKAFYGQVPLQLQEAEFSRLKANDIARCLRALHKTPGSARTLRAFFGHLLESARQFHPGAGRLLDKSQKLYTPNYQPRRAVRIPIHFAKSTFQKIFALLEKEDDWVHASFVRLFFEFDVPASLLMRAKWHQLVDGRLYAWLPGERKYWHFYAPTIDSEIDAVLVRLKQNCRREFLASPYLFPSNVSRCGHITTYQAYWRSFALRTQLRTTDFQRLKRGYRWSVKEQRWLNEAFSRQRNINYGNNVQSENHYFE